MKVCGHCESLCGGSPSTLSPCFVVVGMQKIWMDGERWTDVKISA